MIETVNRTPQNHHLAIIVIAINHGHNTASESDPLQSSWAPAGSDIVHNIIYIIFILGNDVDFPIFNLEVNKSLTYQWSLSGYVNILYSNNLLETLTNLLESLTDACLPKKNFPLRGAFFLRELTRQIKYAYAIREGGSTSPWLYCYS